MKVKISEAEGQVLNYLVAKCQGVEFTYENFPQHELLVYQYINDWAQGGPIIEQEKISIRYDEDYYHWTAGWECTNRGWGYTPLIAAMRAYVASELGDEVEVPNEVA